MNDDEVIALLPPLGPPPPGDGAFLVAQKMAGLILIGVPCDQAWTIAESWLIWNGTGEGGNDFSLAQFFEEEE